MKWVALAELFDITKAFDHLQLAVIYRCARKFGFPLLMLRFLFAVYTAPRHFVIGRESSKPSLPRVLRSQAAPSLTS